MVFCGKASLGCLNCRLRRIKCDKIRPQCTQCVRVAKPCPGYRNQLEVMFRDETFKVMRRAHASWGMPEDGDGWGPSSPTGPLPSPSSLFSSSSCSSLSETRMNLNKMVPRVRWSSRMPMEINATSQERGTQFFVEHYLVGHPDEPRTLQDLSGVGWLHKPGINEMMAAVGLAGLSNLTGNKNQASQAIQLYGQALGYTAKGIQDRTLQAQKDDQEGMVRAVVMLALFEVIRGGLEPSGSVRIHILGAAALIKSLQHLGDPVQYYRALLQLCFSMFVQCYVSGIPLPDSLFDLITTSDLNHPPQDKPASDLVHLMTRLVQLAAIVRKSIGTVRDGTQGSDSLVSELADMDTQMELWEQRNAVPESIWAFAKVAETPDDPFPPSAALGGHYHVYSSMWTARVWNHYRWARLTASQMLLDATTRWPLSTARLTTDHPFDRDCRCRCLDTIGRMSRDTLTSLPTHWRHPSMQAPHRQLVDRTRGGAGIGVAGLPSLLFQIHQAAGAPGVSREIFEWGLGVLDAIWAEMGVLQAKALADALRPPSAVIKVEEDDLLSPPGRSNGDGADGAGSHTIANPATVTRMVSNIVSRRSPASSNSSLSSGREGSSPDSEAAVVGLEPVPRKGEYIFVEEEF